MTEPQRRVSVDPDDPRAPAQEVWDRLSEEERAKEQEKLAREEEERAREDAELRSQEAERMLAEAPAELDRLRESPTS